MGQKPLSSIRHHRVAPRRAGRAVVFAVIMASAFVSSQCRNFGDFWNRKPADGNASGLLPNQVAPSMFAPAAGAYNATQNVSLSSATGGATICYTTDGSTPDCNAVTATCSAGSTYTGPINVSSDQTLKAVACVANMINSPLSAASYTIDTVPPVISAVSPAASSYATTTQVSYTFSESCGSASITWTRTGGSADAASPHVKALVGAELTAGAHNNITITNNPTLVDGAIYDIQFDCTDLAGNAATPVTQTNVTYDGTAPVISGTAPTNGLFVNTTQVSYTLSENCASGSITWTRTGGSADGASPHVVALIGGELNAGAHNNVILANNPTLVSGAIYDITFNCSDAAGNAATPVTHTGVTFDNVAPTITGVAPASSTAVNTTAVSYTLSENCATASITWTRTGGNTDGASPHVKALVGGELTAGTKSNIVITNNPTLVDGAIYSITFACTDAAGNAASPVTRTNVTYDVTAIAITAVAPASNSYRNSLQVSYTFSDICATATITWTRTGGSTDAASPHVKALVSGELTAGAHNNILITNSPTLVDGAIYAVEFNCTDSASNASTPVTVTNVTYDFTVPLISGTAPINNAFVKDTVVSFTFSETCASASITWTRTAGNTDAASPHAKALVGGELTAGAHNNITISNNPTLVDGAIYNIIFNCTDVAGNVATTVTQTNVTFDTTLPTVAIQNLRDKSVVHTGYVIGQATDNVGVTLVEISLDAGAWAAAAYTAPNWKFALPSGISTWRDRTAHTIQVRAQDAAGNIATTAIINVRKGNNRDINGDGYEDIVLSAWQYSTATGRAYVYYGGSTGLSSGSATAAPQIITGGASGDQFSGNMVLADFNGDGFADLAAAAAAYSTNTGRVYVFHGAANRLNGGAASFTVTAANRTLTGAATSSAFGATINASDFNADGYADLVVGSNGVSSSKGASYIFHGSNTGITATGPGVANTTLTGGVTSAQFGSGFGIGDFNNDGHTDLAVAAPFANTNKGEVYVFYGTAAGIANATSGTSNCMGTGGTTNSYFGGSVSAGDINGDGVTDLAVGAYGASSNAGTLYLYSGNPAGFPAACGASAATTITESISNAYFTTSVTVADINTDGFAEVLAGEHMNGSAVGMLRVFYGQSTAIPNGTVATANHTITGISITDLFGRGNSISDINGDGYRDVFVGANKVSTNTGAVYLFYASSAGLTITTASSASATISGEAGSELGMHISR